MQLSHFFSQFPINLNCNEINGNKARLHSTKSNRDRLNWNSVLTWIYPITHEKEFKIDLTAGGLNLGVWIKKNNKNNLFSNENFLCWKMKEYDLENSFIIIYTATRKSWNVRAALCSQSPTPKLPPEDKCSIGRLSKLFTSIKLFWIQVWGSVWKIGLCAKERWKSSNLFWRAAPLLKFWMQVRRSAQKSSPEDDEKCRSSWFPAWLTQQFS